MPAAADPLIVHASCVAVSGRGLLISGASGSGKSSLALALMALGADLVADDRTGLERRTGGVWASCPPTIRGRVEARGLGLLRAEPLDGVLLVAEIDMDRPETERLPPQRSTERLGVALPLILGAGKDPLPAALIQYLKVGRWA